MIDRERAHRIQLRAMREFLAMVGSASEGARVLELDGVTAAIVPVTPQRSIPNSVIFEDADALSAAYADLAAAYDEAGVDAWTVWTPDFDQRAIDLLTEAGHEFDGKPAAMVLDDLEAFREPELGDLDWDPEATTQMLGTLNDAAYGYEPDQGFTAAFAREPEGLTVRRYQARVDGLVASVLATIDHPPLDDADGPDCGIYLVATPTEHRRRGLATRLLGAALAEAHERGCVTSSLQASPAGEPIYAALGYRPHFRFHLYERKRPRVARAPGVGAPTAGL